MSLSMTVADLARERYVRNGGHYFDPDTMRWFGSRVEGGVNVRGGSTIILMSNQDRGMVFEGRRVAVLNGKRHYYMIVIHPDGGIDDGWPKYDVSAGTGYWLTKHAAIVAAEEFAARLSA